LDVQFAVARVAERQCVHTHDLVRKGRHATPHIQTEELTFVKYGAYMFPAGLRDCREIGKPVVHVVQLDAPRACRCRVRHEVWVGLTADGGVKNEAFVDFRINLNMIFVESL
jgi:hypothetical protein